MSLKILITGATDGIGLETAKKLNSLGHDVIVHGRSAEKLNRVGQELGAETFQADLSDLSQVKKLAIDISEKHSHIDVIINNAGVYKTPNPILESGMDIRFVVNTVAPYLLTKCLASSMKSSGRVINLSSAAQASVDFEALQGRRPLGEFEAYAQSKLAITMWTHSLAKKMAGKGPILISVNPGSLLGTKMVREGFGTSGKDVNIGVSILQELALDVRHATSSGKYYDNDSGRFAPPQADGLDEQKNAKLIEILEEQTREFC